MRTTLEHKPDFLPRQASLCERRWPGARRSVVAPYHAALAVMLANSRLELTASSRQSPDTIGHHAPNTLPARIHIHLM
jgi:hypothetical protein